MRQGGMIPLSMTMGRVAEGPERKFCAVLRDNGYGVEAKDAAQIMIYAWRG
mgnify:CR=1 FL=1